MSASLRDREMPGGEAPPTFPPMASVTPTATETSLLLPNNEAKAANSKPAIPPGHVALVIRHTPQDGSGAWIGAFNRVDVVHLVKGGDGETSRQVIVKGILVLDTFEDVPLELFAPATLAVTPAQAAQLTWAMSVGELRLRLRQYGDD